MENKIFSELNINKNVLLIGAPGTGKSHYLNRIAELFEKGATGSAQPTLQKGAPVPIPATTQSGPLFENPIFKKANRKVFRTTLHQNSKYRDFLNGIVPAIGKSNDFSIFEGILYKANEFAMQENSASLLIIDEINRGPAVEVFGGSIVAIEPDKRLSEDNKKTEHTQYFQILSPKTKEMEEYAFSPNLYILAAMNQADVSVAPLDVAFLRRWKTIRLEPNYELIEKKFDLKGRRFNQTPNCKEDYYYAILQVLKYINGKIIIGRGKDYQLGTGIFFTGNYGDNYKKHVVDIWITILTHIEEIFYGDINQLSDLLNATSESSLYELKSDEFAGETFQYLTNPEITEDNIYQLMSTILEKFE